MRWEDNERIHAAIEKLGIAVKYVQEVSVSLQLDSYPIVRVQVVTLEPDVIADMLTALAESDKVELHVTVMELPGSRRDPSPKATTACEGAECS